MSNTTRTVTMTGQYLAVAGAGEVVMTNRDYSSEIDWAVGSTVPAESVLGHILHGQKSDGDSNVGLTVAQGRNLYARGRLGAALVVTSETDA